jgi:hypothetical protein
MRAPKGIALRGADSRLEQIELPAQGISIPFESGIGSIIDRGEAAVWRKNSSKIGRSPYWTSSPIRHRIG